MTSTAAAARNDKDVDLDELDLQGGGGGLDHRERRPSSVLPSTASADSVAAAKPMGILRHQTFAVQYDDDEASLVDMADRKHGGRLC